MLWDPPIPNGFYSAFTRSQSDAKTDPVAVFTVSASFFWLRVLNVWRDLSRGHLWLAIHHLGDVRRQLFVLERLLRSAPPLDYYVVEKEFETEFGSDVCGAFSDTLPSYSADSIRRSLNCCIKWFSDRAPLYAERMSAPYPLEAARQISMLLADGDLGL